MDTLLIATLISILISIAAFLISVIALWQTHFVKFRYIITVGNLTLRIYPIRNEDRKWYIASIDVPISITNEGARSGKIIGLRVSVNYPDLPISNNHEFFIPKWDVDYKIFEPLSRKRFEWIEAATLGRWMSFIILPRQTITKHMIFETRWDEPVIQNRINFTLEIRTDISEEWEQVANWHLGTDPETWSELTDVGTAISCYEEREESIFLVENRYPPDLHKYTGIKEAIPHGGYRAAPSYLDYPDKKKAKQKRAQQSATRSK